MRGWDVAAAQALLARAGFPSGVFDGLAGTHFAAALTRFQAWAGLAADGVAGPATVARLDGPPARSPLRLRAPVAAAAGDGFGPRGDRFHTGIDFPAATGTPVTAAGAGCVTFAGFDDGYGLLVVLAHSGGVTTWYAHLSRIDVRPRACVPAGARVGAVGATGHATGPHLHFEVRVRGAASRPADGARLTPGSDRAAPGLTRAAARGPPALSRRRTSRPRRPARRPSAAARSARRTGGRRARRACSRRPSRRSP